MIYADSSALAKLVLDEGESPSLRGFVRRRRMASSALARTEVLRAVARGESARFEKARSLFSQVAFIAITEAILDSAGRLDPPTLRSLDAIHLASALLLGGELEFFVSYDERQLAAAAALGMPVASPGV